MPSSLHPTWRPGASRASIEARAGLLSVIREFFAEKGVMEVMTPVLGGAGVTDVHIENLALAHGGRTYFLQTSPEYAMKRLLAADVGSIYQIGPVFRGGEVGRRHNVEFTMLEWYRPGFSLDALMTEVEVLVTQVAGRFGVTLPAFSRVTYKSLFQDRYACDPHVLDLSALAELAAGNDETAHLDGDTADTADYLDALFSSGIEPELAGPVLVHDFPASQAALAAIRHDHEGDEVADRFELFAGGMELANGYFELTDADALAARFEENNRKRASRGLPTIAPDEKLLAALPHMPACAGVAMGVDRWLMWLTGAATLDEVMSFSDPRL